MDDYIIIKYEHQLYAINIEDTSGILNSFECRNKDHSHPLSVGYIKTFHNNVPVFSVAYNTSLTENTPQKILLLQRGNQTFGLLITEEIDIEKLELLKDEVLPLHKKLSPDIFSGSVMYYNTKIPVIDVRKVIMSVLENNGESYYKYTENNNPFVEAQPYLETLNHKDLMAVTYKFIENTRTGMLLMKPDHEVLFINESLKLQFNEDIKLNQKHFGNIFACLNVLEEDLQCGKQIECRECVIKQMLFKSHHSQLNIDNTTIHKPLLNNNLHMINISIHPIVIQEEHLLWVTFNT